ncbi:MAG TPA: branched-chain amino acid ABC transporter permease [Paracoccaceae bacterium]|nr:branched-chain amino acid ABC transporter permease [Paracoccaceae bacterium]
MEIIQLAVGGIANGCIYGLVALGFVLIYKASEGVNFAQGDMMMLGAFLVLAFVNDEHWGLPFLIGILLAAALMGGFGFALDRFVIRGVFGQPQFAMVILTIAIGFVLRFVAGAVWGYTPLVLDTPFAGRSLALGGLVIGLEDAVTIVTTLLLTLILWFFFARTRLGLAMQAASQNQLAAYYMGIPVRFVHSVVWGISGVVATIAGVLFASKGAIDPGIGLLGIKAFAAAVIGGFGSLPGALAGGLIVGVVEPLSARFLPAGVSQMAPYVIMLAVLVMRPAGLFAQIQQKKV